MKFELKQTTLRAGLLGGVAAIVVSLLTQLPIIGCVFGVLLWALGFLIGAYSSMLARQAANTSGEPAQDAIDGGIAGAIGSVFGAIVTLVLTFISAGSTPSTAGEAGIMALCFGGTTAFAACGAIIFGGIAGAVGGVVYGLITKNQSGASAGTPRM